MGLDNYWELPVNEVVVFDPPLELWGGVLSGHGQGSFRGKVYSGFFQQQLDVSLFESKSNEEVREISRRLNDIEWKEDFSEKYRALESEEDLEDLKRMFEAYAKAGASLGAWY